MGVIASGGAVETVEVLGDGPSTLNINVNSGIPAVITELFQGNVPEEAIEASLGASYARGGIIGWDVGVGYIPDTQQATVEISVTGFGVGASVAIEGTFDPNSGLLIVNDASAVEAFVGMNIILGSQGELLGLTLGNTTNIKAGMFLDWAAGESTTSHPGLEVSYSHGLILGSIEGVAHANLLPVLQQMDDISLENAVELFEAVYESPLESLGPNAAQIVGLLLPFVAVLDSLERQEVLSELLENAGLNNCFVSKTSITMWPTNLYRDQLCQCGGNCRDTMATKLPEKPIEQIRPGDIVTSYDTNGDLVPAKVVRTFANEATHILDFFGTGVTPGHVFFCGEGHFKGQHVTLLDILRSDGGVVDASGKIIRACTGEEVGSDNDTAFVWAITGTPQPDGTVTIADRKQLRLSTRVITKDGRDLSLADIIFAMNATITDTGMIRPNGSDAEVPLHWTFTPNLPAPEDYVLQRSGVTLEDIFAANEWEQRPKLPAPTHGEAGPSFVKSVEDVKGMFR